MNYIDISIEINDELYLNLQVAISIDETYEGKKFYSIESYDNMQLKDLEHKADVNGLTALMLWDGFFDQIYTELENEFDKIINTDRRDNG